MLSDYAIRSNDLHQLLINLGVKYLYHANTLTTAVTFIKADSLLTRKAVEEDNTLFQTPQNSDDKDKIHEVWDSVFLDGTDHHVIFSRGNYYGPVLFKIKLDLLLSSDFTEVYITRSNPQSWPDTITNERKYYRTIEEVKADYTAGQKREDAQIMFTFRSPGTKLNLSEYLAEIVYDDPKMMLPYDGREVEGRNYLKSVLSYAIDKLERPYTLSMRTHDGKCNCFGYYTNLRNTDWQKFYHAFNIGAYKKSNDL